ncbi:hypothetical protein [Alcanivorax quisquiliarum]|uniref:Uncharacterized protein n=1 Tax=Alcanivorax quisquiliarum TaxID=2933565 RepID=A0ABT0E6V5_9GAMM|nr:hypothetical protein [Alcanivorax quisquiliarum]MCK0537561.1 hypothetical protein [Alcanivorax quisquiliarum]
MGRRQFDDYDQDEWEENHSRAERQRQRKEEQRRRHNDDSSSLSPATDKRSRRALDD